MRNEKGQFEKGHNVPKRWREIIGKITRGKKHSEERKEILRQAMLSRYDKFGFINSPEARKKNSDSKLGTKNPMYGQCGFLNPNYKGGITPITKRIRHCFKYKAWQNQCFKRDNYNCVFCKVKLGNGISYNIDHIIPFSYILKTLKTWTDEFNLDLYESALKFEPFWDINNGRTLCVPCHQRTETYRRSALNFKYEY
ncbi:MAG: NUMOD3 domain-containing DNA-binding protein [Nanoarchaeota archaeon]